MFKVGDRVVIVQALDFFNKRYIGEAGTIIDTDDNGADIKFDNFKTNESFYFERFIHEEIYNSPLYKALKEE